MVRSYFTSVAVTRSKETIHTPKTIFDHRGIDAIQLAASGESEIFVDSQFSCDKHMILHKKEILQGIAFSI